jgi:hypothetical protein
MTFEFKLDAERRKKLKKWIKQQEKKTGGEYGAIGGGYAYCFTPTSLGTLIHVENTITKESINLTNFDNW